MYQCVIRVRDVWRTKIISSFFPRYLDRGTGHEARVCAAADVSQVGGEGGSLHILDATSRYFAGSKDNEAPQHLSRAAMHVICAEQRCTREKKSARRHPCGRRGSLSEIPCLYVKIALKYRYNTDIMPLNGLYFLRGGGKSRGGNTDGHKMLKHVSVSPWRGRSDSVSLASSGGTSSCGSGTPSPGHTPPPSRASSCASLAIPLNGLSSFISVNSIANSGTNPQPTQLLLHHHQQEAPQQAPRDHQKLPYIIISRASLYDDACFIASAIELLRARPIVQYPQRVCVKYIKIKKNNYTLLAPRRIYIFINRSACVHFSIARKKNAFFLSRVIWSCCATGRSLAVRCVQRQVHGEGEGEGR
ncbi:unnamed protein product, partial [Trichogramma brassicae]